MKKIKVSTSTRLKQLMKEKNLKQIDVINKCKPICDKTLFENNKKVQITKSDLSQWLSGKYEPGQWKLTILSEAFNVNPAWLMGYNVPMEKFSNNDNSLSNLEKIINETEFLDIEDKVFLNNYISARKRQPKSSKNLVVGTELNNIFSKISKEENISYNDVINAFFNTDKKLESQNNLDYENIKKIVIDYIKKT